MPGKRSSKFAVTICSNHTNRSGCDVSPGTGTSCSMCRESSRARSAARQHDLAAQRRDSRLGSIYAETAGRDHIQARQYRKHGLLEKFIERGLIACGQIAVFDNLYAFAGKCWKHSLRQHSCALLNQASRFLPYALQLIRCISPVDAQVRPPASSCC